ncbi:MAG: glycosyltransferase [Chlorobi bacterium]|nr:glycosyltransferase [Chlorobiota bacterium]
MENWIRYFMLLLESSAFAYLAVMVIITLGWYKTAEFFAESPSFSSKISVVVAIRNEAGNILNLLRSIASQSLSTSLFELIIVDDNSTDAGTGIIEGFMKSHGHLNIRVVKSGGQGKKQALRKGFDLVENELVFTTDGDCVLHESLLELYLSFFETHKELKLAFGAVVYSRGKGLLNRVFRLEFSSLVASGAASAGIGLPLMANGANMAFKLSAYKKIAAGLTGAEYASGDDVFLVHGIAKGFGAAAVGFVKNKNALVETHAPRNAASFLNQRIRWGSKAKAYKSIWPALVATVVFLFNFMISVSAVLSVYRTWFLAVFVLFTLLKFLVDLPLSRNFSKYFRQEKDYYLLFPLEFIYPFYIVASALYPLLFGFNWKGRDLSK